MNTKIRARHGAQEETKGENDMPVELYIKIREEDAGTEVVVPADLVAAVAALATLTHIVAGFIGVSDEELLGVLSESMVEGE